MTQFQSISLLIFKMLSKSVFRSNHPTDHLVKKFLQLQAFSTIWQEPSRSLIYKKRIKNRLLTSLLPLDAQETLDRSLTDFQNLNINQLGSRGLNLWLLNQLKELTVCWNLKEKWIKLLNQSTILSQKNSKVNKSKKEEWIIYQQSKRTMLMMK